jgi:hypothetical protein
MAARHAHESDRNPIQSHPHLPHWPRKVHISLSNADTVVDSIHGTCSTTDLDPTSPPLAGDSSVTACVASSQQNLPEHNHTHTHLPQVHVGVGPRQIHSTLVHPPSQP